MEHPFGEFAVKASVEVIAKFSESVVHISDLVQTVVEAQFTFEHSECVTILEIFA